MQLLTVTMSHILGILLILSSFGVILLKNPVHASLSFLVTLMMIAAFFLELSAEFISVIQILIYAGAILVIFIFALVLFQDAFQGLSIYKAKTGIFLTLIAITAILLPFAYFFSRLKGIDYAAATQEELPTTFGTVEGIGNALFSQYFFPFEAVAILFLAALVGSIYLAKKEY